MSGTLKSWLVDNKTLVMTLVVTIAAFAYPGPGGRIYDVASVPLLVILFALLGFTLNVSELRHALSSPRFHCACQTFTLFATPLAFYFGVYRWGLARRILTSQPLAIGTMATMCMPTTTNTNVMFTQQAGGEVSAAAISAALGNLLGALVTPATVAFSVGEGGVSLHRFLTVFYAISEQIIAPLLAGLALQILLRHRKKDAFLELVRPYCRVLETVSIVIFLYLMFCKAFAGGSAVGSVALLKLAAFLIVVHLLLFLAACLVCGRVADTPEQRVAFVFTAPQKAESLGIAILTAIFPGDDDIGVICVPIVVYHTIQMIVAACAVARAKRHIRLSNEDNDLKREGYYPLYETPPTTPLRPLRLLSDPPSPSSSILPH